MRRWVLALFFSTSLAAVSASAQNHGSNQGLPMGTPPQPDTSRMQEEMRHATSPAGPLRISFGSKESEWTADKLAALPHTTITVYNEHEKANQNFSGVLLIDLLALLGAPAKPRGK